MQCGSLLKSKSPDRWRARAQVVQEIKVLRSSVSQREKEKAERATLVVQERLVKAKARAPTKPFRVSLERLGPGAMLRIQDCLVKAKARAPTKP